MLEPGGGEIKAYNPNFLWPKATSSGPSGNGNTYQGPYHDAMYAESDAVGVIGAVVTEYNPEQWARMIGS